MTFLIEIFAVDHFQVEKFIFDDSQYYKNLSLMNFLLLLMTFLIEKLNLDHFLFKKIHHYLLLF